MLNKKDITVKNIRCYLETQKSCSKMAESVLLMTSNCERAVENVIG